MKVNTVWPSVFIWIIGLLLLVAIDYFIRLNSDEYYCLGMDETIWFMSHIILAFVAMVFLLTALRPTHWLYKLKKLILAITFGVVWYIIVIWLYVLGSGVDSL